jgi:anti-sigma regulatory factor (Ser/Thr protein kinase)
VTLQATEPIVPSASTATTDILLSFPPEPDAVGAARQALRRTGISAALDPVVMLLSSELMSNAVRHAAIASPGEPIVFHARAATDRVRVEVVDRGPGFDPEVRHETEGFGLRMVAELANDWGVERLPAGCRVWFEVQRRDARC